METTKRKKYIQRAIAVVAVLIGINIAAAYVHGRKDLTAEKRYTLTTGTRELLRNLDSTVTIEVFLEGDFPASFRQLAQSTRELLDEFREYGQQHIRYTFVNPGQGMSDSARLAYLGELTAQGIKPFNMTVQKDAQEGYSEKLIFPGALVHYKGRSIGVNLLKSQGGADPLTSLNNSEALLEYQFSSAIDQLVKTERPLVGYMLGNGESLGAEVYDALNTMQQQYSLDTITLQGVPAIPKDFDVLLFSRPSQPFSDVDKLKLDQYLMRGGSIIWYLDANNAAADSLQQHNEYIAFDRGLNLEDLLFRYGVRINQDLIQDMQCDVVPMVVGNVGNRPQIQPMQFVYFPLLVPTGAHPVVKNMDFVLSHFASSMDTIKNEGVRKTILLTSSRHSKTIKIPTRVSWDILKAQPTPRDFRQSFLPVAVLLEGRFTSLYRHRLDPATLAALQSSGHPFREQSEETKMIVVSDADIMGNSVSRKNGPLQMGVNEFNPGFAFGNSEFFQNSLEYLTSDGRIMESRNKELTLRLLDTEKVKQQHTRWQIICFAVPVAIVLLFAMVFQFIRQRKFAE